MKNMLRLGLLGIFAMGISAIGLAAEDKATPAVVAATGVVVQVKADQGKVKINHDLIAVLNWPQMTMFFRVKDKSVLEGIVNGDKVRFELEKDTSGLAITRMDKIAK
jgi:Cu(I)/Ag(I) efflux system protein CusF